MEKGLLLVVLASGMLGPALAHADVNIGISVTPPSIVVASPPQLVVVPGTSVYYSPSVGFNLFVYNGRYYSFHEGAWFYAPTSSAKWVGISNDRVPRPVLAVPTSYYKVPPGQAKKMGGDDAPGQAREHPGRGPKGTRGHK